MPGAGEGDGDGLTGRFSRFSRFSRSPRGRGQGAGLSGPPRTAPPHGSPALTRPPARH
ncbi:hypothetical protein Stube_46590 [Streptomyces tubercidicus]|uniref:Uncharacterized protein n=1 Tax=Streptomyces tubercidicus TaxID=47759 RepID=A0A640V187_9ACTN|nr:hypothetical protein Stube_46590 [Streptomyces tubercidicus]